MSMRGYRKRTCPKCYKTSMWRDGLPATDAEHAVLEMLNRTTDKVAFLRAILEHSLGEFRKLISAPIVVETMREVGIDADRMELDWARSLPPFMAQVMKEMTRDNDTKPSQPQESDARE